MGGEGVVAAIAGDEEGETGTGVERSNGMVVGGGQNGLFATSLCLCEAGDEIIVPEPMYLTYEASVRASGATLVPVAVDPAKAFHLDCSALEAAITLRTKAIFFATPCNPTGVVMPREDLERIAEPARKHNLWAVADEVYADLTFEREHVSIASLAGMAERTVTIGSLSKSHAMPGWRVGWVIGPKTLIEHLGRLALCMLYGLPGFIQQAALTALENRAQILADMRESYRRRRGLVFKSLRAVPAFHFFFTHTT